MSDFSYNRCRHPAPLFFGMGERSMVLAYDLERRLREAFNHMGGMQQPLHPDRELSDKEKSAIAEHIEDAEHEIAEIALDIFAALTGLKVTAVQPIDSNYSTGLHIRGLWPKTDLSGQQSRSSSSELDEDTDLRD